jgi:hypothetical protein
MAGEREKHPVPKVDIPDCFDTNQGFDSGDQSYPTEMERYENHYSTCQNIYKSSTRFKTSLNKFHTDISSLISGIAIFKRLPARTGDALEWRLSSQLILKLSLPHFINSYREWQPYQRLRDRKYHHGISQLFNGILLFLNKPHWIKHKRLIQGVFELQDKETILLTDNGAHLQYSHELVLVSLSQTLSKWVHPELILHFNKIFNQSLKSRPQ